MRSLLPGARLEDVPVVPEKDEVALVVERHHSAAVELGALREHGREHASHPVSHARREVVQDELRVVVRRAPVVFDLLRQHQRREAIQTRGALGKVHVQQAVDARAVRELLVLVEHQHIREPARFGVFLDLLHGVRASRVVVRVGHDGEEVLQKLEHLSAGFARRGDDHLRGRALGKVRRELVLGVLLRNLFITSLHERLVAHALVLDGLRNLSRFRGLARGERALLLLLPRHAFLLALQGFVMLELAVQLRARDLVLDAARLLTHGHHGVLLSARALRVARTRAGRDVPVAAGIGNLLALRRAAAPLRDGLRAPGCAASHRGPESAETRVRHAPTLALRAAK